MKSKIKLKDRIAVVITMFFVVYIIDEILNVGCTLFFGNILVLYWGYRFLLNNISFRPMNMVHSDVSLEDRIALSVTAVILAYCFGGVIDNDGVSIAGMIIAVYWGVRYIFAGLEVKVKPFNKEFNEKEEKK